MQQDIKISYQGRGIKIIRQIMVQQWRSGGGEGWALNKTESQINLFKGDL